MGILADAIAPAFCGLAARWSIERRIDFDGVEETGHEREFIKASRLRFWVDDAGPIAILPSSGADPNHSSKA
jgi:hypothetical protein